jgi:NhaP-type Na+/H+ or K+/H+ antiporter
LTSSLMLYGVATLAHGSGFVAVFVAGIVIGDARAPYKGMSNGSTPRWPGWLKSWPSPFSA